MRNPRGFGDDGGDAILWPLPARRAAVCDPAFEESTMSKTQQRIRGVLSPVVTPFDKDLNPDTARFINHCKWLISQGCGLAAFGTNSEANSLSVNERMALLDAILAAGIDPARMMPGTGCCSISDSVRLTEHAVKAGCAGVLMLPPFYYKEGQRRRSLPQLLRNHRTRRRRPTAHLPVPHPARRGGRHHAEPRRAPAEKIIRPRSPE